VPRWVRGRADERGEQWIVCDARRDPVVTLPSSDSDALQQYGMRPVQRGDVGFEFAVHNEQVRVLTGGESALGGVDAACRCRF
jgi:hypothetical protein